MGSVSLNRATHERLLPCPLTTMLLVPTSGFCRAHERTLTWARADAVVRTTGPAGAHVTQRPSARARHHVGMTRIVSRGISHKLLRTVHFLSVIALIVFTRNSHPFHIGFTFYSPQSEKRRPRCFSDLFPDYLPHTERLHVHGDAGETRVNQM